MGRIVLKIDPSPIFDSTSIMPLCFFIILFETYRPSPNVSFALTAGQETNKIHSYINAF